MTDAPKNKDFGIDTDFAGTQGAVRLTEITKPAETAAKFRREIDLGDGSGKQVFEAESADALIDKLTEAQRNATLKIQELSAANKPRTRPTPDRNKPDIFTPKPRTLTDSDKLTLANEIMSDPSTAVTKIFEATVGMSPDQFGKTAEYISKLMQQQQEQSAAEEFIVDHADDFTPSRANSDLLLGLLKNEDLPITRNNLEYAYVTLLESGKMSLPKPIPAEAPAPVQPQVVSQPPASITRDLVSSTNAPTDYGVDVSEIQNLPLEQARDRIIAALRQRGAQR